LQIGNTWTHSASIQQVQGNLTLFERVQLPILERITGPNAGAYSNEGDILEADFRSTYFGINYPRLGSIKTEYDPTDLFIVKTGVGSERWDADGICRVKL
jgi:hypothetical protein